MDHTKKAVSELPWGQTRTNICKCNGCRDYYEVGWKMKRHIEQENAFHSFDGLNS